MPKAEPAGTAQPQTANPEDLAKLVQQALEALNYITAEDLSQFEAHRAAWKSDPRKFLEWAMDENFIHVQILNKVAKNPPAGKGSGSLALQAIRDIKEMTYVIIEQIREAGGLETSSGDETANLRPEVEEPEPRTLPKIAKTKRGKRQ